MTAPSIAAPVVLSATVPAEAVRLLPLASLSCTVMVELAVPSATTLVGLAVMLVPFAPAPKFGLVLSGVIVHVNASDTDRLGVPPSTTLTVTL